MLTDSLKRPPEQALGPEGLAGRRRLVSALLRPPTALGMSTSQHMGLRSSGSGVRLPRALGALAHGAVVTEDGSHRTVTIKPTAQPDTGVILGGHATTVPFASVLTGPQRTTTDNHEAASTCAAPILAGDSSARSGFGSRGSVGRGLHRPCRARPADRSLVAEDRSAEGVCDQTGPEPPMLTRLLTGRAATPRDERVQHGTMLRRPPSVAAW
jgi:hypothetical protein